MEIVQLSLFDGKVCLGCHNWFPLTHYFRNGPARHPRCKSCISATAKVYRAAHREETKERDREYDRSHKEQRCQYRRAYYAAHRAKILADDRLYAQRNPEKIRARAAAWRARNADTIREKRRQYRLSNKSAIAARNKKWQEANSEHMKQYLKEWKAQHPDYQRKWDEKHPGYKRQWLTNHPERAKEFRHIANTRRRVRTRGANGRITASEWRGLKARFDFRCLCCGRREPEIKLTLDHVIPLSKDGTHTIANAQPLCGFCNCVKRTKTTDYR